MENNLTEIANTLKTQLEAFTNTLPKLTDSLKSTLEANPNLASEYAKALKDADVQAKIEKLKKDIKSANNTFRK